MVDIRVLFAASEVYPFSKSGGLADVAHSLPKVLNASYDVEVISPLYEFIERDKFDIKPEGRSFVIKMGNVSYPVTLYSCEYEKVKYRFIYTSLLCDRRTLYGTPHKAYEDNDIRFGLFNHALLALLKQEKYQIVHLNDWQCGLLPLLMQDEPSLGTKILFTIHNLAYQGIFEKHTLYTLGIDEKYFSMEGVEFYGKVSFMKAGIAYADQITVVSPTYAKEILTSEFGCGLEGFLQHHSNKLIGIVNGIDTEHFSPSQDKMLVLPYSDLVGKAVNKRAYLKEKKIAKFKKPLIVFIGRFTWQKGMELLLEVLDEIALMDCNIAILGEGEERYHAALKSIAQKHINIHLEFGYDESLSHRMYAASDFFLMPSLFEPCGLAQMIAMAYGSLPIVHRVGGLKDTVHPYQAFDKKSHNGYGVVFSEPNPVDFLNAIKDALSLYQTKKQYNKLIKHNMVCDFSWKKSAKLYIKQYEKLLEEMNNG